MELQNKQFSHGTLNPFHLLSYALAYPLDEDIKNEIRALDENNPEHDATACTLWHEVVYDKLCALSPDGYYFSSTEGDSSDLGWWSDDMVDEW